MNSRHLAFAERSGRCGFAVGLLGPFGFLPTSAAYTPEPGFTRRSRHSPPTSSRSRRMGGLSRPAVRSAKADRVYNRVAPANQGLAGADFHRAELQGVGRPDLRRQRHAPLRGEQRPTNVADAVYRASSAPGSPRRWETSRTSPAWRRPKGTKVYAVAGITRDSARVDSLSGGYGDGWQPGTSAPATSAGSPSMSRKPLVTDTNDPTFAETPESPRLHEHLAALSRSISPAGTAAARRSHLDCEGDALVSTGETLTRVPNGSTVGAIGRRVHRHVFLSRCKPGRFRRLGVRAVAARQRAGCGSTRRSAMTGRSSASHRSRSRHTGILVLFGCALSRRRKRRKARNA